MAAWFSVVKAILPHVGTIMSAAVPAFTRYKGGGSDQTDLLQRQIGELQDASSQNTALIKDLAEQLRDALAALQQATAAGDNNRRRLMGIAWTAIGLALVALGLAVYALTH